MTKDNKLYKDFAGHDRFEFPDFIKRVTAGNGGESLLILGSEKTALYDTGMAYCYEGLIENIERELKAANRDCLDYVFLSHTHYDHIGALPYVIDRWPDAKVVASRKAKAVFASDGARRTMKRLGEAARDSFTDAKEEVHVEPLKVDITVSDKDDVKLGAEHFVVIETKGHTDCSLAYVLEPASIMFASESTGIIRNPEEMHTAFLKSYEDTMTSADKCEAYGAKHIISPHYGMVPDYFVPRYFAMYREFATDERNFIADCIDEGLDRDQIFNRFEERYWTEARGNSQPKPAFKENAVISINTIWRQIKMFDLLLKNGRYPDFAKGEIVNGNVAIKDGKIAYIGTDEPEAVKTIDVEGNVVSPGFIDIHMHEEHFEDEGDKYIVAQMMLEMGVTTAVGGNCGIMNQELSKFKAAIDRLGGSPVNYIMLAGYNQCRYNLGIGRYETATPEQMKEMRKMLKKELDEGAFGISFGIEYDPAITFDEMVYACGVSDDPGLLVAAHYRDETKTDLSPIEEMVALTDKIPQKFQISHLSSCSAQGHMQAALDYINENIEKYKGRLNYDTYPYNAFSTHIGSAVFEDGCLEEWGKTYSDIQLTDEPYKNVRCDKAIFEDARENYPDMLAVAFVMNEDEIAGAISNKYGMVASDAIITNGNGHPRAAGTFPRVLGKYVREDKVVSLIDGIRKITLEPAKRLDLADKGCIKIGADADITVFNPDTIKDGATFEDLHIKPTGIDYVIVDGKIAMDHNEVVNDRAGKFIPYK